MVSEFHEAEFHEQEAEPTQATVLPSTSAQAAVL